MGTLHLKKIEVFLPVGTLFSERLVAIADFHPLHTAVFQLTGRRHVPLVFTASD
jgi:hypothetical protein